MPRAPQQNTRVHDNVHGLAHSTGIVHSVSDRTDKERDGTDILERCLIGHGITFLVLWSTDGFGAAHVYKKLLALSESTHGSSQFHNKTL